MAARDEPGGIKPAIGLAVIRQPVDVPMSDERRIGGIDGRSAADEDDAAGKRASTSSGLSEAWISKISRLLKAKSGTEVKVRP